MFQEDRERHVRLVVEVCSHGVPKPGALVPSFIRLCALASLSPHRVLKRAAMSSTTLHPPSKQGFLLNPGFTSPLG